MLKVFDFGPARDRLRLRRGPGDQVLVSPRGVLTPEQRETIGDISRGVHVYGRPLYDPGALNSPPHSSVRLHDRSRDLIKSGGEWISSVALENALMGHPAVAEAAVIAAPHPKWGERSLACVVLKPGYAATAAELRDHLAPAFAKWWLPDAFEFLEKIPRTATGKFLKSALRERFKDYCLPAASLSGPAAT